VVKWLVQFVLPVSLAFAALGGVVLLGIWLRPAEPAPAKPRTRVADLDVDVPPGLTRQEFLEQVQAGAGLPDALDLSEPEQRERLRNAFKAHPWVRLVAELEPLGSQKRLALDFRRPVLLVRAWGHTVDGEGVLLPKGAEVSKLVVDGSKRGVPSGRLGQRCLEVRDLAQVADRLPPRTEFGGGTLELAGKNAVLVGRGFQVRWPIGQEAQLATLPALTGFAWDLTDKKPPVRTPLKP
jgi:hypothetical protein